MFCCTLLCVRSSIAIILMGKRELIALLILSSWCLAMVGRLFLAMPRGCLRFVIVVFPDHTHLLFLYRVVLPNVSTTEVALYRVVLTTVSQREVDLYRAVLTTVPQTEAVLYRVVLPTVPTTEEAL